MAQTEEDDDKGDDGSDEGDDRDKGEEGGGLLETSLIPPGEEEAVGLLLKPEAGVKSMSQEYW